MNFAKITLVGNAARDIETRYTPNGKQNAQFTVAVNGRRNDAGESPAAFYRITAWGRLAETLDKLTQQGALTKGSRVLVTGRLEPREYEHNGQQRTALEVTADDVMLLDKREQGGEGGGNVPF